MKLNFVLGIFYIVVLSTVGILWMKMIGLG